MSQIPAAEWPSSYGEDLGQTCVRNLLAHADEVIYFKDLQSRFIWLSQAWCTAVGREPEELIGLTDFDVFPYEHAVVAFADEQRIIATGVPIVNKQELEDSSDGVERWVTSTKQPLRDLRGQIIGTFGISRDITRLVRAEEQATRNAAELALAHADLSRVEMQLRTVLSASSDAIALYDTHLRYQYVNAATERLLGLPSSDLVGRTDRELDHEGSFLPIWEPALVRVLATGEGCAVDFSVNSGSRWRGFQSHLAAYRDVDGGPPIGVVASTREVTELKRAQDKLAHQAVHDSVTGLANRVLLMDRLSGALLRMNRGRGQVALLFVDLDHFKEINDRYGHDTGDRLLMEVGRRLTALARQHDTVARFGGDEFVLLCDELRADEDVRGIADRVVRSLFEPFTDNSRELLVSGSVGVAVTTDPHTDAEDLVRDADAAMYQAKERGRNRYQFFDTALRDRATAKSTMEVELVRALERGQFRLVYQPLVSLSDRHIVGVEALIRWEHPELGALSPSEFTGVAEDHGLIVPIGTWALDEACRQMVAWRESRHPALPELTMVVGVSSRQLRAVDFADIVKDALGRHGLGSTQLCLKITETALRDEVAGAREALRELAALGVHVALDDFGTGSSSLAHLLRFPIDVLKIDRSFLSESETDEGNRTMVAAVIAMAHVLDITVVGEDIATDGQDDLLAAMAGDDDQGRLLGRR